MKKKTRIANAIRNKNKNDNPTPSPTILFNCLSDCNIAYEINLKNTSILSLLLCFYNFIKEEEEKNQ